MPKTKYEYQTEFYISDQGYFCLCQENGLGEQSEILILTPNQVKLIQFYLDDDDKQNLMFSNWGDGLEREGENG